MAILTEEVGEVARIIARRYGEQSEKASDKNKDLGEELSDVLFVTLCLANQTGIDLQQSFNKKLEMKTIRDWERHQNNEKLFTTVPHSEMLSDQLIEITGSKSESNRLLLLQKLFGNISLSNVSNSEDTTLMSNALAQDGNSIDIHHAGTAMRFLTAYFAQQEGREVVLTGSARMKQRPIKPLVDALLQLDASIEYVEKAGYPPLKIKGKKITKNEVSIPANISSQFISALLLIGAKLENGLTVNLEGSITSLPYLMMTVKILNQVGIEATLIHNQIKIKPQAALSPIHFTVESDWSSASYYYSLAAIGKKKIRLKSFKQQSLQADFRAVEIYQKYFGIATQWLNENEIELSPIPDFTYPEEIHLNMNNCPDMAQTVCVTATALQLPFYINGLSTLKVKETDRLVALQNELQKIGLVTQIDEDSIRAVEKVSLAENIKIKTYNDHRMAMAFAPFALKADIAFEDAEVVKKSYPDFWKDFYKVAKRKL